MKIRVDWDSGPYAIYLKATGMERERYEEIVEVPDDVYERYDNADDELRAAEDALESAIESARRSAKPKPTT